MAGHSCTVASNLKKKRTGHTRMTSGVSGYTRVKAATSPIHTTDSRSYRRFEFEKKRKTGGRLHADDQRSASERLHADDERSERPHADDRSTSEDLRDHMAGT